ncbi:MAG: hypothetical protein JST51_05645 [Armatimonadetes bacterium]|nr:hypothetical protein [Armatimonadota bacterium]
MLSLIAFVAMTNPQPPIDRHALVSRHDVLLTKFDGERPLQVGNGEFAFDMDITGLQTFAPFNIMSHWGWHSSPLPPGVKKEDYQLQEVDTHGRMVPYPLFDPKHPEISEWLAANPHRINLGRIGMTLRKKDGTIASVADLRNTRQRLDLWSGVVTSTFELEGTPVSVTTACDPHADSIAAKIESPLLKENRLTVFLDCPGNDPAQFANFVGDWSRPKTFQQVGQTHLGRADFIREIDHDQYSVSLSWSPGAELVQPHPRGQHDIQIISAKYGAGDKWLDVTDQARKSIKDNIFELRADNNLGPDPALKVVKSLKVDYTLDGVKGSIQVPENDVARIDPDPDARRLSLASNSDSLAFTCAFSPKILPAKLPDANAIFTASAKSWPEYWKSGGAIDLSQSKDPRWKELERRIVLSQYLMKVNEAGSLPPQESGLVNNGWFGKFHMEMLWWHGAHWALWNRWPELNPSLTIYKKLLPEATALAKKQGYEGARWPKCMGPTLVEWPHPIHSWLTWQQPHPLFFAELDYRAHPTRATLEKWQPIVEASADFMATYPYFNSTTKRYDLGPPIHLVSENTDPLVTKNPTYELSYYRTGLRIAQEWRKRMGLKPNAKWAKVEKGLAPLPVQDGRYVLYEGLQDMWTKWTFEHPALTGVMGMLPGDGVDPATMKRTLDQVSAKWDFNHTWGWDFPMLAMCAAKVGEPNKAIDFLMTSAPGFQFDERGLATGGPFPYFPSNGGLLYAVALMAKGWDGAPSRPAPGFPADGSWTVRYEGLSPAL